jgi:hypothetical protein
MVASLRRGYHGKHFSTRQLSRLFLETPYPPLQHVNTPCRPVGRWCCNRVGNQRQHWGWSSVQQWPRVCRVVLKAHLWRDAGSDACEQIQRRQREIGSHHQNGRSKLTSIVGRRHDLARPTDKVAPRARTQVADVTAGTQASARRNRRHRSPRRANKTARIVWAVLTRNEPYTPHTA